MGSGHRIITEVHEQMSRSGGQSEAKPPQCFSPQASLVLIYRPTEGMKGRVDIAQPGIEPGPVVWKRDTLPLDNWASSF
ncbi:hypothetical protein TNCV_2362671 [Trichonephila clavipes]|nr:hypothetical protein TNCV_2362671 [Trichonephila clavipes]